MHELDLNFHKVSSKNTVFAINRAIRSIESGSRFLLGSFTPIAFEFVALCGVLLFYCGPLYLGNMLATLGVYTWFSKAYSKHRQGYIRTRKNHEKESEFYLNESVMNYETVKQFNNEVLERERYGGLLDRLKKSAMKVQNSLSLLNAG